MLKATFLCLLLRRKATTAQNLNFWQAQRCPCGPAGLLAGHNPSLTFHQPKCFSTRHTYTCTHTQRETGWNIMEARNDKNHHQLSRDNDKTKMTGTSLFYVIMFETEDDKFFAVALGASCLYCRISTTVESTSLGGILVKYLKQRQRYPTVFAKISPSLFPSPPFPQGKKCIKFQLEKIGPNFHALISLLISLTLIDGIYHPSDISAFSIGAQRTCFVSMETPCGIPHFLTKRRKVQGARLARR